MKYLKWRGKLLQKLFQITRGAVLVYKLELRHQYYTFYHCVCPGVSAVDLAETCKYEGEQAVALLQLDTKHLPSKGPRRHHWFVKELHPKLVMSRLRRKGNTEK